MYSYIPAESTQRVPIKWATTQVPLVIVNNSSDVTASQSSVIFSEVINTWNMYSPITVTQSSTGNNILSYSSDERYFGPGVVAVTVLSYDPGLGKVTNGNILINQTASRGFCLTADKAANICTTPGAGLLSRVYLGDVVAHEMGHFFGLSHSEVRDSTMLFTAFKGQYSPHSDDISGLRVVYGKSGFGTIRGKIEGGNHVPIFGAHVQAISTKTGIVAASSISQEDGSFSVSGLNLEDTYYIYTEPLNYLTALPDAYRSAKNNYCPNSYVGSFFETCGTSGKGHPQPLKLTSSQSSLDIGVVSIRCQMRVGEDYLLAKVNSSGGGEYNFTASTTKPASAFVGYYSSSDVLPTSSYSNSMADTVNLDLTSLPVPSGSVYLELKFMTASIGSPLDFSIEIDGPNGVAIDSDRGGIPSPALDASTLRPKYDRILSYPLHNNPALNNITVKLMPRALSAYETAIHMPVPEYFVKKDKPWFMIASVIRNGAPYYLDQVAVLSDNYSCIDAPYSFAVKANPVSSAALAGETEDKGTQAQAAACGTWQPPSSGGPGSGSWMATLFVGFILIIFIRHRRFPH
ncbi:MAG: matrixin family metalloprotease [Bacteriovoracaceae bacterium]|nr:matrixin family metalloprotease [Bacteriovoracaceae bacterium]